MNSLKLNLSIILPTINEASNLLLLVPEIYRVVNNLNINSIEVLVLDDGSTDNTPGVIDELSKKHKNLKLIRRKGEPSLPMSIWEGIDSANGEFVMWLDADGSMTAEGINSMLERLIERPDQIVIGSRFVENGGYKGVEVGDRGIFSSIQRVYKSEDSVLAVMLSKVFNNFIYLVINCGIKDVTSGFIVGKKTYFSKKSFSDASYGDYFIYIIKDLKRKKLKMVEVGYICETRKSGFSKSGTSFLILFKRALPYFKAAFKVIK